MVDIQKVEYSLHSAAKNITGHKKSWARNWESQTRQFLSGKMGYHLDKDTTSIPRWLLSTGYSRGLITRKGGMRPWRGVAYRLFCGVSKGQRPHLVHDFAKQSVVLYALSALS